MMTLTALREKNCHPTERALAPAAVSDHLALLPEWSLQNGMITRTFSFKNYHETLSFTNAIASMIHVQDHHPELVLTYNRCTVRYNTHSVNGGTGGISENDFICAARIDAIFDVQQGQLALRSRS